MKYQGYFIEQNEDGTWEILENTGSGFNVVNDYQKTAQHCIDYINDFLL